MARHINSLKRNTFGLCQSTLEKGMSLDFNAFPEKIIATLPLDRLWDKNGFLEGKRGNFLSREQIAPLLDQCEFVIANLGYKLEWIDPKENYSFWKKTLKTHLCDMPDEGCSLVDFEGGYFYFASLWEIRKRKIILLEMHH